ncbi:MAG TPA: hypothetical protein VF386_13735 [Usitatibacter sp.]
METLLAAYEQPIYRYRTPLVRAMLADLEGRFAEADALSREALSIIEEHRIAGGMSVFTSQRIGFLHTRGDTDGWSDVEPIVLGAYENGDRMLAIYRCMFECMFDRQEAVRASLAMAMDRLRAMPDAVALAAACALAKISEHAQVFYDLVASELAWGSWQFGPGRVTSVGPRELTLGRLAVLLGRDDDALAHFSRARSLVARLRSRPYLAQIDLAMAEVLAKHDRTQSRLLAESARTHARDLGMRGVGTQAEALLETLGTPNTTSPPPVVSAPRTVPRLVLECRGEMWWLAAGGDNGVLLKDTKGLSYLQALVREPCRELHALDLVGLRDDGDAGVVLDTKAKAAYRERVESLREQLAEATSQNDLGRAERARTELDALATELSRAVGLGGRDRRAVSPAERARINVQRRLRDVLRRVQAENEALGEHLALSVRTGVFCVYLPAWR